jgi:hypothetical protein
VLIDGRLRPRAEDQRREQGRQALRRAGRISRRRRSTRDVRALREKLVARRTRPCVIVGERRVRPGREVAGGGVGEAWCWAEDPEANDPDWAWEEAETAIVDSALPQPAPRPMRFRLWVFVRAGWPFEAFRGWSWQLLDDLGGPNEHISHQAFAIVRVPLLRYGVSRTGHFLVPYYPLWPGFIANSLIYAALCWLVIAGLVSARAARRARRGLCTRCAYDLRGVTSGVCPECGQARPT